ncbi:MAG: molybdopterin molybdotransferase MoeA [Planctomycetaceae bacterium]
MTTGDVRMRGFRDRTEVARAVEMVDAATGPLPEERVAVTCAAGRVLARDVVAPADVPGFARAAMDGYAVIAEETFGATPADPRPLRVVGESFPARPASARVSPGHCVRIMTGAPIPEGADAVVPFEQVESRGDSARIAAPVPPGKNVGQVGEDARAGTILLRAGRLLRPQDVGVLSSAGCAELPLVRRPRVALLMTGDELLPPGARPAGYRIADANSPMLRALAERDGALPLEPLYVRDDGEAVRQALLDAVEAADCVLVSGGSSVGSEDHAPAVLAREGSIDFHGVAMRPSSPAGMGRLRGIPVFLLPGNPVSCLCAYDFFAGRALRRLGGRDPHWPYRPVTLPLLRKLASALGRTDYARVRVIDGGVEPLAIRGAAILTSTTRADGFVVVPQDLEGHPEGGPVTVWLY